jgi:hypothetical protein
MTEATGDMIVGKFYDSGWLTVAKVGIFWHGVLSCFSGCAMKMDMVMRSQRQISVVFIQSTLVVYDNQRVRLQLVYGTQYMCT